MAEIIKRLLDAPNVDKASEVFNAQSKVEFAAFLAELRTLATPPASAPVACFCNGTDTACRAHTGAVPSFTDVSQYDELVSLRAHHTDWLEWAQAMTATHPQRGNLIQSSDYRGAITEMLEAHPAPRGRVVVTEAMVEAAARMAHEVNRAYCESVGDHSQVAWEDAPEWQKASAREGVAAIVAGRIANPGDAHRSWYEHKVLDGWTYGAVKDAEAKTHPCLVPFEDLPNVEQIKDHLFVATVRAALALVDADAPEVDRGA